MPLKVLVLDDQVPDSRRGSGMGRMAEVLDALAGDEQLEVAFHPQLHRPGAEALLPDGVRFVRDLKRRLRSGADFDVVIVSRPHNASLYRRLIESRLPESAVIYDTEAIFYRRLELQVTVADPEEQASLAGRAEETRLLEEETWRWADAVVCLSQQEADIVSSATPAPVYLVEPWPEPPGPTKAGFEQRRHIGLVAGWAAGPGSPNADGLRWFALEVLPRVRVRYPGARLLVSGAGAPEDVAWLEGATVHFEGEIPDIAAFYEKIRVAISPTRFGAGVKSKTVEALQYAVPLVCTEEAAAGLAPDLAAATVVAPDERAFAEAVVTLLSDQQRWEERRAAELSLLDREHTPAAAEWPRIVREVAARKQEGAGERADCG